MRKRIIAVWAGALLIPVLFSGCEAIQEAWEEAMDPDTEITDNPNSSEYKRKYVIHVNSIVRHPTRSGELEREIPTLDGGTVWINTNQLFSSKNIRDARVVSRPGNPDLFDLPFLVDRFGKLQWQMLSGNYSSEQVALVVDGVYFGRFYPEPQMEGSGDWVTLRVGLNAVTARGIARNAKKNYINLNPDVMHWF